MRVLLLFTALIIASNLHAQLTEVFTGAADAVAIPLIMQAQTNQQAAMKSDLIRTQAKIDAAKKQDDLKDQMVKQQQAMQSNKSFLESVGNVHSMFKIINAMYCLLDELFSLHIIASDLRMNTCFQSIGFQLYGIRMESQLLLLASLAGELGQLASGSEKASKLSIMTADTDKMFKEMKNERMRMKRLILNNYNKNRELDSQSRKIYTRLTLLNPNTF